MFKHRWLLVLFVISCCTFAVVYAAISAEAGPGQSRHIDIPTKLQNADTALDFGYASYLADTHLSFES